MQIIYSFKNYNSTEIPVVYSYKTLELTTLEEAIDYLIEEGYTKNWQPILLILDKVYTIVKHQNVKVHGVDIGVKIYPLPIFQGE